MTTERTVPALRLLTLDDASDLADLVRASRDYMAPWEPSRDTHYYTAEGQREVLESSLSRHQQLLELPYAILGAHGRIIGRVTLTDVSRGPFQSCNVGYWVSQDATGQGAASAAVRAVIHVAFDALGLHRIQAGTLVHNVGSRRVLENAGFEQIGLAPAYLRIDGAWRDHVLYQAVRP